MQSALNQHANGSDTPSLENGIMRVIFSRESCKKQ